MKTGGKNGSNKLNKIPNLSFNEIQSEWENTKTMDFRSRMKSMRRLVAAIDRSNESLTSVSALLYIDILKEAGRFPDLFENAPKILSKLIQYTSKSPAVNKSKSYGKLSLASSVKAYI